ncbi:MAG: hypothetical protein AB7O62_06110 [Pirellulales bacterium]
MEAPLRHLALSFRIAIALVAVLSLAANSQAAQHQTPNFVVEAATQQIAQQVGDAAERFRHDLAIHWLGEPLPKNWSRPCPITVKVGANLGAGGATSFMFNRGEVYGWRMNIQGTLERVLDSVLPHEVTHTIFASHFRQPLPRWADEGACTTVEHVSERTNHQRHLQLFLRTGRGIPFNRMFEMKDYPQDVMPLYAQGHSVVSFLLQDGGQGKFIQFVQDGLKNEQWSDVTRTHYGYPSLAALQDAWLNWVREGSIETLPTAPAPQPTSELASNERPARPEPNLIYRGQNEDVRGQTTVAATARPGPGDDAAPPARRFAPLARVRGALDKVFQRGEWQPITEQAARPLVGRAAELPVGDEPAYAAEPRYPAEPRTRDEWATIESHPEETPTDADDGRLAAASPAPSQSGKVLLEWRRKSTPAAPDATVSRREEPTEASDGGRVLRR